MIAEIIQNDEEGGFTAIPLRNVHVVIIVNEQKWDCVVFKTRKLAENCVKEYEGTNARTRIEEKQIFERV